MLGNVFFNSSMAAVAPADAWLLMLVVPSVWIAQGEWLLLPIVAGNVLTNQPWLSTGAALYQEIPLCSSSPLVLLGCGRRRYL